MNFKMLKGGAHPHYGNIKKESHRSRCYFYLSIERVEQILELFNDDYNILNYRFMFDLPTKSTSHAQREFINHFKNNLHHKDNMVYSIMNYNEGYLNSHGILLINPQILIGVPKNIKQYLVSKDHFDIGFELFKHYIFEHFIVHLKKILPHLKLKNGTVEV